MMAYNHTSLLSVVQCNLQRSRIAQQEFLQYFLKNRNVNIAIISEPYVGNLPHVRPILGVTVFQFSTSERIKACIFVKEGLPISVIGNSELSTSNLSVIDLKIDHRTFTIASVYIEPRDDLNNTLVALDRLLNEKSSSCAVIGGDFNGNHPLWGSDVSDVRGEEISHLCSTHDFYISNVGNTPTFEVVRQNRLFTSIDDLTLVSGRALNSLQDWKVDRTVCPCSDHNAITYWIDEQPQILPSRSQSAYRYQTKNADWAKFHSSLGNNSDFKNLLDTDWSKVTPPHLDSIVTSLTSCIQKACDESMKRRKGRKSSKSQWWTTELDDLKKEVTRLHHQLSRLKKKGHNIDAVLIEYLTAKEKYASLIRSTSTQHFREFCTSQGKDDVWAITNKLLQNYPPRPAFAPTTLRTTVGFTQNSIDTAQAMLDYFFPDDLNPAEINSVETEADGSDQLKNELPFTQDELLECSKLLNPRKSPGNDHLTADICRKVVEKHPKFMANLFNRCLDLGHFPTPWKEATVVLIPKPGKSDPSELSSRRPIGLLPVFSKILEKLFLRRIAYDCLKENLWNSRQFGFRPQKSSIDALQTAVNTIRQKKSNKQQVIAISLDICSAFNNARWPDILRGLIKSCCSENLFRLIRSYFKDRWVELTYNNETVKKEMTKGCIQGSVAGPTFWNLILDELLALPLPSNVHVQAFADDVFLVIWGNSARDVERTAAEALEMVSTWGISKNLTFNPDKTQWISFTKKVKDISLNMGGQDLVRSSKIKLLGVILDERLSFFEHIRYAIQKASRVYKAICLYVRPTWGLNPENVEIIYHSVIEPMVSYAARIWGKTAERPTAKKTLNSFQRLFAIKAIRGFRTVSHTSACALAQFIPLNLKITEVYRVEKVKSTGKFEPFGSDVQLEVRSPVGDQLHPRDRSKLTIKTADSEAEVATICNAVEFNIFTDGSKMDTGETGAAVVLKEAGGFRPIYKLKLNKHCSVFQAELFALQNAVDWIYSNNCQQSTVNIYSDSLSALLSIVNYSEHPMVSLIHRKLQLIKNTGTCVTFVKVKAHIGILGNEKADEIAKLSSKLHKAAQYKLFPLSAARRHIQDEIMKNWEEEYAAAGTGAETKKYFPTISHIRKWRRSGVNGFATTQFLTGHGYFKSYLRRFNITQEDLCPCGQNVSQTPEHLIKDCSRFERHRLKYILECRSAEPFRWSTILIDSSAKAFAVFCEQIVKSLKLFNEPVS